MGPPVAASMLSPFLVCVPSVNRRSLLVTWTRSGESFLHEAENPHTAHRPGRPSGPGPLSGHNLMHNLWNSLAHHVQLNGS